jgi:hypothetical protein
LAVAVGAVTDAESITSGMHSVKSEWVSLLSARDI